MNSTNHDHDAVDCYMLETRSVINIVRRTAQLELLRADILPTGRLRVIVDCDFGLGPSGGSDLASCPHTVNERLANLSNRCRLVLLCDDREGDDLLLVRRSDEDVCPIGPK